MSAINNLPGLAKFNNATHVTDGLMSRNDKEKLDSLHKSVTVHATLYASEWSANRPYMQTIEISDISADTNGTLTIDPAATEEEINACTDAEIIIVEQSNSYITLQVTGNKPEVDIPVVIVFGENLAVITSSMIVDDGNHVHNVTIQPTDWESYFDIYKANLYIPGITEDMVGSISMKSNVDATEAFAAARARIEILSVFDDTVELILRGEKPNIPLHVVVYYGPSIAIVKKPAFGGKVTPHAKYQEFDDSKTGLGVTTTQSAIEEIVCGPVGIKHKVTHFKTVAVMKEAMNIQVGQVIYTSGYRTENDGGGATYIITSDSSKEDNGGSVHVLKNGLRAEIVHVLGEDINLKCFGLYGDGIHDDSVAFNRGFEYCKSIKGGTVRWQGTAALDSMLVVDSHYINIQGYGYGSKLKANYNMESVLKVSYEEFSTTEEIQQILIGNFRIDGNELAKHGLVIDDNLPVYNSIFENIYITDTTEYGLVADCCKNNQFNLITMENCNGGIKVIGTVDNCSFNTCEVKGSSVNEPLLITVHEGSEINERPSNTEFNSCYFGDSQTIKLLNILKSINIDFNKCIFDLKQTLSTTTDYPIIVGEYALYTRFNDCFLNGRDKTCGILNNMGVDTVVRNFKAVDIKSTDYHVLSTNTIHVSDFKAVGDSTPLVIYTPNDDKSIVSVGSAINAVNSETNLFPSNANYYNIYMNQKDEIGIKGKLNNYVLDKYLENEIIEVTKIANDIDTLNHTIQLPLAGVWDVDMVLVIDDGNYGKIARYQVAFKQNTVYSVANIQELSSVVSWGSGIQFETPTIDKLGNLAFKFVDTSRSVRSTWTLKLKIKRVIGFEINE